MRKTVGPLLVAALVAAGVAASAPGARAPGELAFVRWSDATDSSTTEIYRIRDNGTGLVRLTRNRFADTSPTWSPDGARILFVSNRDGDDELFVMDRDGGNMRQLTRNRRSDLTPRWSPDGRLIAFASDRGRTGEHEIWMMRTDGTRPRRLVDTVAHPAWQDAQLSPTWSPDGRRVIFSMAVSDGNPELFVVDAGGAGLRRLTVTRGSTEVLGDDTMPDWSRDGRTVAFVSNREGRSSDLWAMRPDGSRQRPLARRPATDDWNPRVSPDGLRVAFTRYPIPQAPPSVWVMHLDSTTAARQVVNGASEPDWRPTP